MDMSIIICTTDDPDIAFLIDSINRTCEVVVVCCASKPTYREFVRLRLIEKGLKHKIIAITENRLSLAREVGTQNATHEKVVHIDTDCIFTETALDEYYALLEIHEAVDGLVDFSHNSLSSRIISMLRSHGLPEKMLCPSIGFQKKIVSQIGGYYFDKRLSWIEDSEFNDRLIKAKIKFVFTSDISCIHKPLTFQKDLSSAFNYGKGARRAAMIGVHRATPVANWFLIAPMFSLHPLCGLYSLVWNIVYCIGFYYGSGDGNHEKSDSRS